MNRNKPICRFYQKGYCRYGRSCRFQHPGEENNDNSANDYSFKTGFSFTRALESTIVNTNDIDMSDTPASSIFSQTYQQIQQQRQQQTPQNLYTSFSPFSSFEQQKQTQQQTPIGGVFSPFSFQQRQQELLPQQQQQASQPHISNIFSPSPSQSHHNQQVFQQSPLQHHQNHISFQKPLQQQTQLQKQTNSELSEAELKAFQSDKFEFRKIPVRPPPPALC